LLGGKSVNGLSVLFPYEDSVPYHLYWQVLNTKEHGIPQNRERIFLIGIRDDQDNFFQFPKKEHLLKKLKDVLEDEVDEKYFVLDFDMNKIDVFKKPSDQIKVLANTHPSGNGMNGKIYDSNNVSPTITTNKGEGHKILSYTLGSDGKVQKYNTKDVSNTLHTATGSGGNTDQFVFYNRIRRLTPRECFRLQDFPDSFDFSVVSDTQAYKQAGNSITVRVLEKILLKLKL
jgi:DNA (cytosine-5)-methyltransferase 1